MVIMTSLALVRKQLRIERYAWIVDVFGRQLDLVMDDVANGLMADFAQSAIGLDPAGFIRFSAIPPRPGFVKRLSKFFHGFPWCQNRTPPSVPWLSPQGKNKKPAPTSSPQREDHRHRLNTKHWPESIFTRCTALQWRHQSWRLVAFVSGRTA